jgi:hypothetical protein
MEELVGVADGPTGCGEVVRVGDDLLGRLV